MKNWHNHNLLFKCKREKKSYFESCDYSNKSRLHTWYLVSKGLKRDELCWFSVLCKCSEKKYWRIGSWWIKSFNDFIFGCILLQSLLYTAGVWSVKFVDHLSARILINQYKLNKKVKRLSRLLQSINYVCPKSNLYLSLNMWKDDHIFRINTWKSQKMLMFIFFSL